MLRSLHRAAGLLLVAACSRSPELHPPDAAASGKGAEVQPHGTATRVTPPPGPTVIRPRPAPCLPAQPHAAPGALAEAAEQALDDEKPDRALACAEEAIRLAPRLTAALAARANALADLGRLDEARLAFARALAVDPDDPRTLLDAADLYVRRLSGARDAVETGLEYAERGTRTALRPRHRDRDLAARLELVAGMAENDLGRSDLALAHLDRAVAALPREPDAVYERGVALFELCRFDEAKKAFERTLSLSPDDAWATHQLGLIAERRGDTRRAEALLARARGLSPDDFPAELSVDARAFQAEVDGAIAALPPREREALQLAPVEVRDLPDLDDLRAVDPPLSPSILGLYRGPAEDEACTPEDGPQCRSIVFYRKNLVRFARTREELHEQVRVTLLHELGHLHGETDDELRDRGLE
jgi:tetratricopeptide (TPR) repeat protein